MWKVALVLNLLFQTPNPVGDSLISELKKTGDPAAKASIYYNLAKTYYGADQDLAIAYADSSLSFSSQVEVPKMKANALNIKAVAYLIKSDFETSMKLNLEALKIRETIRDTIGLVESHLNIGNILYRTNKSNEAVERYKKALIYAKIANSQRGLSLLFNNIGSYYRDRWKVTNESSDLDSAKVYLSQSLEIKRVLNDSRGLIHTYNQLSELALSEKKYMLAENYLNRALEVSNGIDDAELQISVLTQLTEFNLEVGDKSQALGYAKNAFEIAEKMESNYMISNTSGYVADAYEALGDYRNAFLFNKRKMEADRILNDENKQKVQEDLLIQYESEKKELENQRLLEEQRFLDLSLRRKNELLIGSVIILIGLIGLGFLQRKKNAELAAAEQDLKGALQELTLKNSEVEKQSVLLSEANTALRESNSVRERLLSVVSHDLKTPLTSLQTLLDYWDKKLLSEQELNELLPRIAKQTETVNQLLENLLEWAQTQIQYSQLQFTEVNLRGLVEESIKLAGISAEGKRLRILNEIPEDLVIYTDKDRLNFIVRNLVSNALKFTKAEGLIKLTFDPVGKGKIQIADNGVGMSQARVESLFSRKMGASKGTEGEKGSGVGLLLCKEFAESIGASLEVTSKLNEGSTFTIHLG
ncbi:ATP-binding protein [Algoriphagus aquatilis]|uniref:histidine kinase n=1 Tax=Algoriphagus aquatilis TaxID=490186 RepID=A0ABW0C0P6_9BACT